MAKSYSNRDGDISANTPFSENQTYEPLRQQHSKIKNCRYDTLQNIQSAEHNYINSTNRNIEQADCKKEQNQTYQSLTLERRLTPNIYDSTNCHGDVEYVFENCFNSDPTSRIYNYISCDANQIADVQQDNYYSDLQTQTSYDSKLYEIVDGKQLNLTQGILSPKNTPRSNIVTIFDNQRRQWLACFFLVLLVVGAIVGTAAFLLTKTNTEEPERQNITDQVFNRPLVCEWDQWSSWTDCKSVSCGNGTQYRSRQQHNRKQTCYGTAARDTRTCTSKQCQVFNKPLVCEWDQWSSWTGCSVSCGNGTQYRSRRQNNRVPTCIGEARTDRRTCFTKHCQDRGRPMDIRFDPSTLNANRYLSRDNRILSNQWSMQTQKSSPGRGSLQMYSGVIADQCFGNGKKIFYRVSYDYHLKTVLSGTNLILEVGLAQRDEVDQDDFVGQEQRYGWSFSLAKCGSSKEGICFRSKHLGNLTTNEFFSENNVGLQKNGIFEILIDRQQNKFSLKNSNTQKPAVSFENVASNKNLCPVFGVHNIPKVNVKLKIIESRDVTHEQFEL